MMSRRLLYQTTGLLLLCVYAVKLISVSRNRISLPKGTATSIKRSTTIYDTSGNHYPGFSNLVVNQETVIFIFSPTATNAVPYVEHAVSTAKEAGWSKSQIVVIDTSFTGQALDSDFLREHTALIYQTIPRDLTFSMLHNVAASLAKEWDLEYYFWMHADVVIFTVDPEKGSFAERALAAVREASPGWGVIFFAYDLFAAYRTAAVYQVKWDHGINHYGSDCDFYARIRLAGYSTEGADVGLVMHKKTTYKGSILNETQNRTIAWYKQQGAWAGGETPPPQNPTGVSVTLPAARARYNLESKIAGEYYQEKWGKDAPCDLPRDRLPNFDIPGVDYRKIKEAMKVHSEQERHHI